MNLKLIALVIVAFGTNVLVAQTKVKPLDTNVLRTQSIETPNYQLFPTQNMWIFIKLDTRTGKMWQVQFDVGGEGNRSETVLNAISLLGDKKEIRGRYTLYATQNIYNFILLDQINGQTYQVQWSFNEDNRAVVPID